MSNVIGYNGTPEERLENWQAMLIYRKGSTELLKDPSTKAIAIEDKGRYNRFLHKYLKRAA